LERFHVTTYSETEMTYKDSILYNPEYHEWWPKLNSNQENKRKRLVCEYG